MLINISLNESKYTIMTIIGIRVKKGPDTCQRAFRTMIVNLLGGKKLGLSRRDASPIEKNYYYHGWLYSERSKVKFYLPIVGVVSIDVVHSSLQVLNVSEMMHIFSDFLSKLLLCLHACSYQSKSLIP